MEQIRPDGSRVGHRPSNDDWSDRLARIEWSRYQTAYGEASPVQSQLGRLRSANEEEALAATHDLWCGLCHQHVQIGSAALPALPFLLEVFADADDRLKTELLDIFLGLAITSNPRRMAEFAAAMENAAPPRPQWIDDVRSGLENALPSILPLRTHADPDIAYFARQIADELASTNASIRVQLDQPSAADFYDAVAEFTAFVVKQGYPPSLLWVKSSDVVIDKWSGAWTCFVWKGNPSDRERSARRDYQSAVSRDVGVALEAHCKTNRWAICRVFVPLDEDQAERLMIPRTGVKHSAVDDPLSAVLVENKWWWWVLKRLAKKSPPAWE
ncbi:hypothetical protein [uncultured Paludibaculum sp.]|uniref:hypothetical protein n=1 Tax=uncultured Paludibaculum sp. TaxID=1765020 RepID=UPI002AABF4B7|nr:hypothetical protein [uncultured Paludibaculum sp.]